jgi:glycosyltransferase involved in cell wall biosynthesis
MNRNILVLTYWSYNEALIQTYTLPYVHIMLKCLPEGSKIYLLTLEKSSRPLLSVEEREQLERENIVWLSYRYFPFGFLALLQWIRIFIELSVFIINKKIAVIHAWCTPAGAAGYVLSLVTGKKLIIDSYEPHAEAMVENKTWKRNSFSFRLLFWLERKQTERADYLISATAGMKDYAMQKYNVLAKNFFVKPACVDFNLFSEDKRKNFKILTELNLRDKIVCVYAGKFGGIYLDQEVFDFLAIAEKYWGNIFRVLLLTNHTREEIVQYCKKAGVDPNIVIMRFVSHAAIPEYMGVADFALTPVKPVPSKRYCTPIKDGEYWALGLPIVIPDHISDDSEIVRKNKIGVVLDKLDSNEYRRAVQEIDNLIKQKGLDKKIRSIGKRYRSFDIAETVYQRVYGEFI